MCTRAGEHVEFHIRFLLFISELPHKSDLPVGYFVGFVGTWSPSSSGSPLTAHSGYGAALPFMACQMIRFKVSSGQASTRSRGRRADRTPLPRNNGEGMAVASGVA